VDLVFDGGKLAGLRDMFGESERVAFEVKSMPGPFREVHSRIERLERSGEDAEGLGVSSKLEEANTILTDARPTLRNAVRQLRVKCLEGTSRNVFLIVHPFDRIAWEAIKCTSPSRVC
jgi:hypothetical protein